MNITVMAEKCLVIGDRQLGTTESEPPQRSGHNPTGITWCDPIIDVSM